MVRPCSFQTTNKQLVTTASSALLHFINENPKTGITSNEVRIVLGILCSEVHKKNIIAVHFHTSLHTYYNIRKSLSSPTWRHSNDPLHTHPTQLKMAAAMDSVWSLLSEWQLLLEQLAILLLTTLHIAIPNNSEAATEISLTFYKWPSTFSTAAITTARVEKERDSCLKMPDLASQDSKRGLFLQLR